MSNTLYGYFGKQLRVSLSTGEIKSEDIDVDILRKYIGGVGYGARVLGWRPRLSMSDTSDADEDTDVDPDGDAP